MKQEIKIKNGVIYSGDLKKILTAIQQQSENAVSNTYQRAYKHAIDGLKTAVSALESINL